MTPLHVLLVDNYDSFTHNLAQLVAVITGRAPRVVRSDALSLADVDALRPDALILSPGPGTPERAEDVGIGPALVRRFPSLPTLGVCLGHQTIGVALGGRMARAPEPMHGRLSAVRHEGAGLFAGLPSPLHVVRYHSLVLDRAALPPGLRVTAESGDGLVMAIAHEERPLWGVQFHPESILTEAGAALIANFLRLARQSAPSPHVASRAPSDAAPPLPHVAPPLHVAPANARLLYRRVGYVDGERAFSALWRDAPHAFWLDGTGRWSYLGAAEHERIRCSGRDWERVRGSHLERRDGDPFALLDELLGERRLGAAPPPFAMPSGYVGYLGYELARFAGGPARARDSSSLPASLPASLPDLQLLLADRVLALDHERREAWLSCLLDEHHDEAEAARWLDDTEARLIAAPPAPAIPPPSGPASRDSSGSAPSSDRPAPAPGHPVRLARGAAVYRSDVARIHELLRAGETYEICLTNQARTPVPPTLLHPLDLYRVLRRDNPAPYSAYLRLGDDAVLCASPERFVHIDAAGAIESRPIKGTRRRGRTDEEDGAARAALAASEKDRAENLMIVDLVRHDLGGVCVAGSVHVPTLMAIEPHPTVFQMVSTVRGTLRAEVSSVAAVRAMFPGGSMTGAPKIRAMRIIDELEGAPRGVYSGGLGFFGFDGAVDLAMAIRTIIWRGGGSDVGRGVYRSVGSELSFGIGGAVVALSDAEEELEEALLKGQALVRAIRVAAGEAVDPDERPE